VHHGEAILTASENAAVRSGQAVYGAGAGAGGGGGDNYVVNVSFTNNGGAMTDAMILQHANTIARAVAGQIRNRNSALMSAR